MRPVLVLSASSVLVLTVLAACVGDDPAPGGSSSGATSSSGAASSSGNATSSSGNSSSGSTTCAGDTIDACGTACTKCVTPMGGTVACTNGACVGSCTAPQALCTDKCVDTKTNADHCSKCGRSCGGGTCTDGLCQPVQIATATAMIDFDVVVDGTTAKVVMNMDTDKIRLCDLAAGCNAAQLKSIASGLSNSRYLTIATTTAGKTVFFNHNFGDNELISKCSIDGCPGAGPELVESVVNDTIGNVVAGPNAVVWTRQDYSGPYIEKCVLPACSGVATIRPMPGSGYYGDNPAREQDVPTHKFSPGANTVLWSTGGLYNASVFARSCAMSDTNCTSPTDVDTAAGIIAVTFFNGKHYALASAQNGDSIISVADAAGTTTRSILASDDDGTTDIAVDASGIYWVNGTTGQVRRCPNLAGCTAAQVETVAIDQAGAKRIRLDANNVYWMTDTKVFRVVKP